MKNKCFFENCRKNLQFQLRCLYIMLPKIALFSRLFHPIQAGMSYVRANQRFTPKEYNAYFQSKMSELDLQCGDIIRQLGNDKPNVARLNSLLNQYLDTAVKFNQFSPRTLRGLVSILSAIDMTGCDALNKYKFPILQQTNRVQLEGQSLSQLELSYFITAEADFRKTAKQKVKSMRLLFNLLAILQRNFDKVHPKHYFSIAQTLTSDVYTQNRMVKVAHLFEKYAISYLKKMIAKQPNLPYGLQKIFNQRFLCLLSETYKSYGAQNIEDFDIFYKYVQQKFLGKFFSGVLDIRYSNCNYMYRNFNYQLKKDNGVYYKQMFLDRLILTLLNTSKNVTNFASSRHGYFFCSSILTHYFYMHSKTLKYIEEGSLKYVPRSQLQKKPQLPDVFWSIYRLNPQSINQVSYLQNTIRDVYPQKYIPTKGESVSTIEPFLQTEMKLRAESVLTEMGLSFKSEINISGRFVDFLIGDNILLQMDGIHHFELNSMEMTDKCHARNLHLLLKGYRMAIVNIYEYNLAREHEELKELIKAKLSLLEQKDAVLVL